MATPIANYGTAWLAWLNVVAEIIAGSRDFPYCTVRREEKPTLNIDWFLELPEQL